MIENIYIGKDSISYLSEILKLHSGKKVFLVTGKSSYRKSGAQEIMESLLKKTPYFRFSDFEENPKFEDVKKGIKLFNEHKCDLTIAIGGGSAIDIAKLINSLSRLKGNLVHAIKSNLLDQKPFPFIAIPTTAGTGSEATHFAVVYIDGEKCSFAHKYLLPDFVIVDSQFTYSTPSYLTACTGADALCQAIESMWATGGNIESKKYAEKAIELVWNNLVKAVVNNDLEAKNAVSEGAYWAGKAINISKTTASHAMSYKMTSLFNIPHGHAVALTLSRVMELNYKYAKKDIEKILDLIEARNLAEGITFVETFWKNIGLNMKLRYFDIREEDVPVLANCNLERMKNNPATLTPEKIVGIFKNII